MRRAVKTVMLYVQKCQAINNLAAVSSNAKKIVEAGGLQHYIKLSGPEYDKSIQTEAARGLYLLASKCRDSVVNERGCLDGRYSFVMFVLFLSASLYDVTLVKEALIEIGCVVTSLVVGWLVVGRWLVGCHARALWPNGAS